MPRVTRSYPDHQNSCEGCRFWSERIARSGPGLVFVEALCLCEEAEHRGDYVYRGCGMYEAGEPIDLRA
jgi:hypothetical protein